MTNKELYPFCTDADFEKYTAFEMPDINRCRKIKAFYDNKNYYYAIIDKFPNQKFYRDHGKEEPKKTSGRQPAKPRKARR